MNQILWIGFCCLYASSALAVDGQILIDGRAQTSRIAMNEYIVRFQDQVTRKEKDQLHATLKAAVDRSRRLMPQMDLVVTDHPEFYRDSALVKYIELNHRVHRFITETQWIAPEPESLVERFLNHFGLRNKPNDPGFSRLWGLNGQVSTRALEAWEVTTGSKDIIVAVVDTGIEVTHPDLQSNRWLNEGEISGNGIDDDGNGYIDDVHGYDMIKKSGWLEDGHYHGTHVSGTIGALGNNGTGVVGVNWHVRLMGLRAVPSNGDETDADVVESFLYAADNGARVINCSFGKRDSSIAVQEVIDSIADRALIVIAAGNDYGANIDSTPTYPASFNSENILTVASTNRQDRLSSFSNIGPQSVDVGAPGESIYSTKSGNSYGSASGTSMATPFTAGAAALVLSAYPGLTPIQVKEVLMVSGDPLDDLIGKTVSGKRINLAAALEYALENYPETAL